MTNPFPRLLLLVAALLLLAGGVLHARAFGGALAALSSVSLPHFYSGSFKALWLIDSATLVTVAALLVYIAARPGSVTRWVLIGLALIPAATAVLIYSFVGPFFPVYVFVTAAVAVAASGAIWKGPNNAMQVTTIIGPHGTSRG